MAVDKSNPAGRLYHFFSEARRTTGGGTKVVLAALLKVPDHEDLGTIIERLILLREAVDEAEQQLSEVYGLSEACLRPYPKIREAITYWFRAIDKSWNTTTHYLRDINLEMLEVGADALSKLGRERAVEKETLGSFLASITQLIEDVTGSNITPELKNILLKHLQNIREAIELYDISGMLGFRDAQEAALGAVLTNSDLFEAAKGESVVKRFVRVLGDIGTVYKALEIAEKLYRVLGP